MADALMTFRHVAKQLAEAHGFAITFMPKPLRDQNGSGLHLYLTLLEGEKNAFSGDSGELGLSPVARAFAAGLLEHARASSLVTNQTVNSYERLVPGYEAPCACTWARANWCDLVRIPILRPAARESRSFLELRSPDPACNPYLAFAVALEAGLDGIRRGALPPPLRAPEVDPDAFGAPLPRTLREAAAIAGDSPFLADALGDRLIRVLRDNAQLEWSTYHRQIGAWELERCFDRT